MAQKFTQEIPTANTSVFQDAVLSRENDISLRSSFSGTAFPISAVPGQHCYRTDIDRLFIFDGAEWREVGSNEEIGVDIRTARGEMGSLSNRLAVSINPDGTLKDPLTANLDEFKVSGLEPTFVDEYRFSIQGDVTGIFTDERILKIYMNGDVELNSVVSSTYSTGTTFVTVAQPITNQISAVDYSLIQYGIPKIKINPSSKEEAGLIQLATQAEVTAGEVLDKAITPATLKPLIPFVPSFASQAEVNAGAITDKVTSPATVKTLVTTSTSGLATVTRGSNANGYWTRFSDGTQICRGVASVYVLNEGVNVTATFPVAFANTAYHTAYGFSRGGAHDVSAEIRIYSMAANYIVFRGRRFQTGDGYTVSIYYTATGSWK